MNRGGLRLKFNVKKIIKSVPGANQVFEVLQHFFVVGIRVPWHRLKHLVRPSFRPQKNRPNDFLVAVTVSTNYSDLLKICLGANKDCFDKWIVVTAENDTKTLEVLAAFPQVAVMFWDPKRNGAVFDKGSGVRLGQKYAYKHFPNSWYVVIDSDIVLEGKPGALQELLPTLSPKSLYGIERWDYASMFDLKRKVNGLRYQGSEKLLGYFQLYAIPYFYSRSRDASLCDLRFLALFRKKVVLESISGSHLGQESHWQGRREGSEDFIG